MVAVNVVFWVTVVFALAERGRVTTGVELEVGPDQLPEDDGTGRVGLGETVASVGFLAAAGARARVAADKLAGDPRRRPVPVLDPSLWSGGAALAAPRARRVRPSSPSWPIAAAAGRVVWPSRTSRSTSRSPSRCSSWCGTGNLFNPAFVDVLVEGGWADAERDLNVSTAIGVVVVLVWSVVETLRNLRRAGRVAQA